MPVTLKSDFHDWYDHAFSTTGEKAWNRDSKGGMKRSEMIPFLQHDCQISVPLHGIVKEVVPTMIENVRASMGLTAEDLVEAADMFDIDKETSKSAETRNLESLAREAQRTMYHQFARVVVYTDETLHRGEGKILIAADAALKTYPDAFCTQYIPTRLDGGSFTQRLLIVGDLNFIIEYASDDWRSNCGDVQIAVVHRVKGRPTFPIPHPVYAIDFAVNNGDFRALDLNIAPNLEPIKPFITATEIYEQVERYL